MIVQEKVLMSANNPLRQLSTRRLLALCRKESYQIVRDPSSILIAFILPVVLLFIFGYGINLDTNRVRLGLLQQDNGADAQNFAAALMGSPSLEIIQSTSRPALEQQLRRGAIRGMVVIDPDFSASLQHNQQKKPLQLQAQSPSYYPLPLQSLPQPQVQPQPRLQAAASIQVLTDGSEPNTANFLGSYVQGALQIWQVQRARDLGLPAPQLTTLEPRYWFNPGTISRNYLVPGSISVIMTVIGALLTSLVVARMGTWNHGSAVIDQRDAYRIIALQNSALLCPRYGGNAAVRPRSDAIDAYSLSRFALDVVYHQQSVFGQWIGIGTVFIQRYTQSVCRSSGRFDGSIFTCHHAIRICV